MLQWPCAASRRRGTHSHRPGPCGAECDAGQSWLTVISFEHLVFSKAPCIHSARQGPCARMSRNKQMISSLIKGFHIMVFKSMFCRTPFTGKYPRCCPPALCWFTFRRNYIVRTGNWLRSNVPCSHWHIIRTIRTILSSIPWSSFFIDINRFFLIFSIPVFHHVASNEILRSNLRSLCERRQICNYGW